MVGKTLISNHTLSEGGQGQLRIHSSLCQCPIFLAFNVGLGSKSLYAGINDILRETDKPLFWVVSLVRKSGCRGKSLTSPKPQPGAQTKQTRLQDTILLLLGTEVQNRKLQQMSSPKME